MTTIKTISEYFEIIQGAITAPTEQIIHKVYPTIFRGEKRDYEETRCLSLIGRHALKNTALQPAQENSLLASWINDSTSAEERQYPQSPWEQLMWARHHELKTRLTDWTTNPLVALWFACQEASEPYKHAYVYILKNVPKLVNANRILSEPFLESTQQYNYRSTINGDATFAQKSIFIRPPNNIHHRINRQSGVFHACSDIEKSALDYAHADDKVEFRIPSAAKASIIADLNSCNINEISLGLETPDSLAKKLNKAYF